MMTRTSQYLVPLVLGAMAAVLLFVAGCGREEEVRKAPPLSQADGPSVYMKDPKFRAALDEKNAERKRLLVAREKLLDEMERRVDAMRAKLAAGDVAASGAGGAPRAAVDDAAVKKELEKDPEWRSLMKRIEDANEAYNDNRKAATRLVGERLAPRPGKSAR